MELIFIRHGQGEHNLDVPDRLERRHPHLTEQGRKQVLKLGERLAITEKDLWMTGPTVRTIETLELLTQGSTEAQCWISPLLGPRMFPQHPEWTTLPCDISLTRRNVEEAYPWLRLRTEDFEELWEQGINTRPQADFVMQAEELLDWLRQQERSRVFAVSHDGTIHAYRELLSEQNLSRDDFLGEAGTYVLNI